MKEEQIKQMSLECIPLLCMAGSKGQPQSSLYINKTKYNIHAKIITERIFLSGFIKVLSSLYFHSDKLRDKASEEGTSEFTFSPSPPHPKEGKN